MRIYSHTFSPMVTSRRKLTPQRARNSCSDKLDGIGRDLGHVDGDVAQVRWALPRGQRGSSDQHDRGSPTRPMAIAGEREGDARSEHEARAPAGEPRAASLPIRDRRCERR
jgi:hypothetical protein